MPLNENIKFTALLELEKIDPKHSVYKTFTRLAHVARECNIEPELGEFLLQYQLRQDIEHSISLENFLDGLFSAFSLSPIALESIIDLAENTHDDNILRIIVENSNAEISTNLITRIINHPQLWYFILFKQPANLTTKQTDFMLQENLKKHIVSMDLFYRQEHLSPLSITTLIKKTDINRHQIFALAKLHQIPLNAIKEFLEIAKPAEVTINEPSAILILSRQKALPASSIKHLLSTSLNINANLTARNYPENFQQQVIKNILTLPVVQKALKENHISFLNLSGMDKLTQQKNIIKLLLQALDTKAVENQVSL